MTDGVQYIGGMYQHWERDYYIEKSNLKAGKYFVFVEIDWHEVVKPELQTFCVTCYGNGKVQIADNSSEHKKEEFLKAAFIAKLDYSRKGLIRETMADKGAPLIKRYLECNHSEGYNYIIIKN